MCFVFMTLQGGSGQMYSEEGKGEKYNLERDEKATKLPPSQ